MKTKDLSKTVILKRMKLQKSSYEEDHNFNWGQKKFVDSENRLLPRKMKKTIHFLKNINHINKISYMSSVIWFPNLYEF